MQRAFVVRLGPNVDSGLGRFEGWVEDVDTSREFKFRSADELLKFMVELYEEALRQQKEGK
jgi:hypothetical protein